MKILYVFDSQDHEVFKMSDLPDRFEIIREGKKPIVFKPAAIQMQDLQGRLDEAEALLLRAKELNELFTYKGHAQNEGDEVHYDLEADIDKYFDRKS